MDLEYTTFQTSKILGIKYGRLREWIDRGDIIPSVSKADGQGTKTIFSKTDLYLIGLFAYLIDRKIFTRKEAAERVRQVSQYKKVTKSWSDVDSHYCIAFYFRKEGYLGNGKQKSLPWAKIFSKDNVIQKSLNDLLFQESEYYYSDFDDVTVVNFRKIIEKIDAAIEH